MCDYPLDEDKNPMFLLVAEALDHCQSLEMALKRHIGVSFEVARKYLGGRIIFKLDEREFDKKALGSLVETYSKLTEDLVLVKELRDFIGERNFLAHKAITESYLPDGTFSPSSTDGLHERVGCIGSKASDLYNRVYKSSATVLAHVWFDDVSDDSGSVD